MHVRAMNASDLHCQLVKFLRPVNIPVRSAPTRISCSTGNKAARVLIRKATFYLPGTAHWLTLETSG